MSAGQSQHRILLVCCSKLWQDSGSVWQHWDFSLYAWLSLTVVLITNSLRIPSALCGNLTGIAAGNLTKLMKRDSLCEVDLCESHWYNDRVLLQRDMNGSLSLMSNAAKFSQTEVRLKSLTRSPGRSRRRLRRSLSLRDDCSWTTVGSCCSNSRFSEKN